MNFRFDRVEITDSAISRPDRLSLTSNQLTTCPTKNEGRSPRDHSCHKAQWNLMLQFTENINSPVSNCQPEVIESSPGPSCELFTESPKLWNHPVSYHHTQSHLMLHQFTSSSPQLNHHTKPPRRDTIRGRKSHTVVS